MQISVVQLIIGYNMIIDTCGEIYFVEIFHNKFDPYWNGGMNSMEKSTPVQAENSMFLYTH